VELLTPCKASLDTGRINPLPGVTVVACNSPVEQFVVPPEGGTRDPIDGVCNLHGESQHHRTTANDTVWTTNFDQLLEKAFGNAVIYRDVATVSDGFAPPIRLQRVPGRFEGVARDPPDSAADEAWAAGLQDGR
jgi:hypothetical protein